MADPLGAQATGLSDLLENGIPIPRIPLAPLMLTLERRLAKMPDKAVACGIAMQSPRFDRVSFCGAIGTDGILAKLIDPGLPNFEIGEPHLAFGEHQGMSAPYVWLQPVRQRNSGAIGDNR
jgi:hypothetical protein